jgi:hypothetical protein
MTKYFIDKTREKQPVIVWINRKGQLKGVYREALDAQHDMEESGEGGYIVSTTIIKPREREIYPFL